jgi:hypothetical protein
MQSFTDGQEIPYRPADELSEPSATQLVPFHRSTVAFSADSETGPTAIQSVADQQDTEESDTGLPG